MEELIKCLSRLSEQHIGYKPREGTFQDGKLEALQYLLFARIRRARAGIRGEKSKFSWVKGSFHYIVMLSMAEIQKKVR